MRNAYSDTTDFKNLRFMRCGHEELDQLMVNFFSFSASQHQTEFSCCFWKCDRNAGHTLFYACLSKTLSRFLHTYHLHLLSIPDRVIEGS
jgi:hypothetical protein